MVEILFAKDVGWDRHNPCNDCPFLKTSPYHEGIAANLQTYMECIEDRNFAHTCHKTDNRERCDGPRNWKGQPKHCAGAILMLLKTGKGLDLQLPLLEATERGDLDLKLMTEKAKTATNVFTVLELLAFYGRELGKRLRTPRARAELRRVERRRAKRRQRRTAAGS